MYKIIVTYGKAGECSKLSHIELMKIIETSLKESEEIPLRYIDKLDQKLDIAFVSSLPIGMEGFSELFELGLTEKLPLAFFIKTINNILPKGIAIFGAEYLNSIDDTIIDKIHSAIYEIELKYPNYLFYNKNKSEIASLKEMYMGKMRDFLNQDNIMVVKKSKDRMEKIDIKTKIKEYNFLIDNSIQITVSKGIFDNLDPNYIMLGYNEYIDEDLDYTIKRLKILYD